MSFSFYRYSTSTACKSNQIIFYFFQVIKKDIQCKRLHNNNPTSVPLGNLFALSIHNSTIFHYVLCALPLHPFSMPVPSNLLKHVTPQLKILYEPPIILRKKSKVFNPIRISMTLLPSNSLTSFYTSLI